MLIDCQSHVFPQAFAELLTRSDGPVRAVEDGDGYTVLYGDVQRFRLAPSAYDPQKKIADMDRTGIDVSVVSVNIPGPDMLPTELGIEGARICNDYIADLCSRHPRRFAGFASLPLQDMDAALNELDRAIRTNDLRGVMLFSHINNKPVDSPDFEPFYQEVERQGIPLIVHPTVPPWGSYIKEYSMIPMFGLMVDTSIAVLRLILGGVLERHPNLIVVHPHCGGVIPYLMPRIEEQTEVKRRGRDNITKAPGEYYKNIYLDVVSPSSQAMNYVLDFAGPDRLLFGSDHPWVKMESLLACVEEMDLSEEDKDKILYKNAASLFGIAVE